MDDGDVRRQTLKTSGCRKARSLKGLKNVFALGLMLCLSAAPAASRAQGEPPPVLDPADIFTDAVEVVETLPILNADNAARMLWYFDPAEGEWRGYAYPEGVEAFNDLYIALRGDNRTDGTYIVPTVWNPVYPLNPKDTWIFDPSQGAFSLSETMCNRIKALEGEGEWVLYQNLENNLFHFCFTETGVLTSPLPNDLNDSLCEPPRLHLSQAIPATSPNGMWIIFTTCNLVDNALHPRHQVHAYQVATGEINYLGETESSESLTVFRWLDNTSPVLHGDTLGTQYDRYVYIADVTQPDSLELVASQFNSWPQYYVSPPRYVWIGENNQGIHEYILDRREERTILDAGCSSLIVWCIAVPNHVGISVEEITLVAVLEQGLQEWQSIVTIYDVATGETIYTTKFATAFGVIFNMPGLVWLHDLSFLTFNTLDTSNTEPDSAILVSFSAEVAITETIDDLYTANPYQAVDSLSPDRQYLLVWTGTSNTFRGIDLLNIASKDTTSVILPFEPSSYDLKMTWQDDNQLLVTVSDRPGPVGVTLARWLIRIP